MTMTDPSMLTKLGKAYEIIVPETNTPAWLLGRQSILGASEAPAILQMSRWDSPRDVQQRKFATYITDEQNEAMEFGHLMEPIAVELFRRRHSDPDSERHTYLGQIAPSPGLARSLEFPHLGASLDAVITEDDGAQVPGQIKNVSQYKEKDWLNSEGQVPDDVRVQVLQECIVFGSDHGFVLPIFGGNHMPEPFRVDLDTEWLDWYTAESAQWWQKYVVDREPAPATILDDLSEIWDGIPGSTITLTDDLVARAKLHKELGQRIKAITDERDALKLDIQNYMGTATEALRADGTLAATWRPYAKPRQDFDLAQLKIDHPDLVAAYTRDGKTPRPFLSK